MCIFAAYNSIPPMTKAEIFHDIVDYTCEVCNVSKERILNSRDQDAVNAKIMATQYLIRLGYTPDEIARLVLQQGGDKDPSPAAIKSRAKSINRHFRDYSGCCIRSSMFCTVSEGIAKYCSEKYKTMYLKQQGR